MTKQWVEEQMKAIAERYRTFGEEIIGRINANFDWTDEDKKEIIELVKDKLAKGALSELTDAALDIIERNHKSKDKWLRSLVFLGDLKVEKFQIDMRERLYQLEDVIDSEKIVLDGDIIITDPCYVIRDKDEISDDDWRLCDYGNDMQKLGFEKYLSASTICGDWTCVTINSDTGEVMGTFCADAGMVGVFLFDDVLRYNPKFNTHIVCPQAVTVIRNFKGIVQIVIEYTEGLYKEDSVCHKAGEK